MPIFISQGKIFSSETLQLPTDSAAVQGLQGPFLCILEKGCKETAFGLISEGDYCLQEKNMFFANDLEMHNCRSL